MTPPLWLVIQDHHQEMCKYSLLDTPQDSLVLGYPWLTTHQPVFNWATGTLQLCASAAGCLSTWRAHFDLSGIPLEYHDLACEMRVWHNQDHFLRFPSDTSRHCHWSFQAKHSAGVANTNQATPRIFGFANFSCRLIRNYSSIAPPLTSLLREAPSPQSTSSSVGLILHLI